MGGKASAASKNAWNAAHYDRIALSLPKGKKAEIQQAAQAEGKSVNAWITEAIDKKMGE